MKLRATQYLPDIIKLQQYFARNVNVDDEQVTKKTVMNLQQGIKLRNCKLCQCTFI